MHNLHQILLYTHIGIGLVAIISFWLPVAAKKGSRWHVRSGKLYVYAMYAVVVSAFVMCVLVLFDPVGVAADGRYIDADEAWAVQARARSFAAFLLMLSLLVFSALRHGLLALRLKNEPQALKRPQHRALLVAMGIISIVVGSVGFQQGQILLMVFAVLGITNAIGMLRDTMRKQWTRGQMIVAHLNGLLGTGVGAYTAVFAFGGSRLLAELLPGQLQVIPWITPAIIGTIATSRLKKRYDGRSRERSRQPAIAAVQPAFTKPGAS